MIKWFLSKARQRERKYMPLNVYIPYFFSPKLFEPSTSPASLLPRETNCEILSPDTVLSLSRRCYPSGLARIRGLAFDLRYYLRRSPLLSFLQVKHLWKRTPGIRYLLCPEFHLWSLELFESWKPSWAVEIPREKRPPSSTPEWLNFCDIK